VAEEGPKISKKLGNQILLPSSIISYGVGQMSLEQYVRGGIHGTIWIRAVLASVVLLAALAARKVAPHFQAALDTHTTIEPAPATTSDFGLSIAASNCR
jgi:hypothetical protein